MRTIDALPGKSGRKPVYDWDTLLDGQARVLVEGEDFTSKVESFTARAAQVARDRGLSFSYRTEGEGLSEGEVAIQAIQPTEGTDGVE